MLVKTRFPVAACLAWLTIVLAAGNLPAAAETDKAQADPADAKATDKATDKEPEKAAADAAEKLSLQQQRIHDKFQHLERMLLRMAELSELTDPRRAALLKKAVKQSGDQFIDVQFEALVRLLRQDQLSRALENQKDIDQDLRALLELLLSENRAKRIEAEKTRIRNYLKRLNRIIKEQKDVQGRTKGPRRPKRSLRRAGTDS